MSKLRFNFIIIYKYLVVGQPLLALFHLFSRNPLFQPLQLSITNQGNFKHDPFLSFPLQISLLSFFPIYRLYLCLTSIFSNFLLNFSRPLICIIRIYIYMCVCVCVCPFFYVYTITELSFWLGFWIVSVLPDFIGVLEIWVFVYFRRDF